MGFSKMELLGLWRLMRNLSPGIQVFAGRVWKTRQTLQKADAGAYAD